MSAGCLLRCAAAMCVAWAWTGAAFADEPVDMNGEIDRPGDEAGLVEAESPQEEPGMKTLGGRQFWGDVVFFRGWRIQQNVLTGHFRLLDPQDARHASGTLDECRSALASARCRLNLAPMSGRAILLIHGISRSSKSFSTMQKGLQEEGALVVPFDYPSMRMSIYDAAEHLHQVIQSLEGIEQIDIVVHSMGGLVVRAYLKTHQDPRLHRMVMLGTPNHGARLAGMLRNMSLFKIVMGPAGQELVDDPEGFISGLPVPAFEFAIIAGARGVPGGFNPLIPGDDDGTVELASTRLAGAADFLTIGSLHLMLMRNPEVIASTRRFLNTGALRESGLAEPIPAVLPVVTDSTPAAATP